MAVRDDWRARVLVGICGAIAPIVTMAGIGATFEDSGGVGPLTLLAPLGLAVLVYLVLRHRRLLGTALLAGVLGGWAVGVGIRLAMFLAAEMGGGVERTVGGTVGLVLFAGFPGVLLSGLLLALGGFVRLTAARITLIVTLIGVALMAGPVRAELFTRGNGWVNLVTFAISAALGGWIIGRTQQRLMPM